MSNEEYELQHQRDLEYLANFTIMDDDFMKKVLDNKRCTQTVLRVILSKPDLAVTQVRTEYVVHNLYGRSVRLDVSATDSDGAEYDIEIQRSDKGAGAKRARYNSSLIDADALKKGADHDKLPESFVIFIAESDVLGRDEPIYHIDRIIRETGEEFKDGAHIIYVNGENNDDTALGRLMHDFKCRNAGDMYYNDLADMVRYFKEDKEGVKTMCRAMEEMRAEAAAEAEQRSKIIDIKNLMETLKLTIEQAMSALKIPAGEQEMYRKLVMA